MCSSIGLHQGQHASSGEDRREVTKDNNKAWKQMGGRPKLREELGEGEHLGESSNLDFGRLR